MHLGAPQFWANPSAEAVGSDEEIRGGRIGTTKVGASDGGGDSVAGMPSLDARDSGFQCLVPRGNQRQIFHSP